MTSPSSKTQAKRTLRRVPGNEITTEAAITSAWSETRADPNGYYEVLGLNRNQHWTMADIHKAYRRKARIYHPDGSAPDPKLFTRIRVANEVLSNPQLRAEYDRLDQTKRWVDERVINLIREKLGEGVRLDLGEIVKEQLDPTKTVHEQKLDYDTPCYYYDTDAQPDREKALSGVEHVVDMTYRQGYAGLPLRVGFTDQQSHIVQRPWGRVLMVGESAVPPIEELLDVYYQEVDEPL